MTQPAIPAVLTPPDGERPLHLLDPDAVAAAGAAHGQLAGRLPTGGLALACSKPVEEEARATLLLVPELIRIDVWRSEENLSVVPRNLSGYEVHHTFDALTRAGYRNKDAGPQIGSPLQPVELWAAFNTPREPIFFLALVTCVSDEDLRCHHFMGKGEAWFSSQAHRDVRLVS